MKPLMPFRIFNKAKNAPEVKDQHWYTITAAAEGEAESNAIEVYIYGEIGGWGITAKGDFLTITKRINGGTNGLEEREALYKRALEVLQ